MDFYRLYEQNELCSYTEAYTVAGQTPQKFGDTVLQKSQRLKYNDIKVMMG